MTTATTIIMEENEMIEDVSMKAFLATDLVLRKTKEGTLEVLRDKKGIRRGILRDLFHKEANIEY